MQLNRRFAEDESGSSVVEFVVMLPFLLAMIGFAGGYAEVVSQREMLNSAAWDSARLLSRAPTTAGTDINGNTVPVPYQYFLDEAEAIIANRMSIPAQNVNISVEFVQVTTAVTLREPFYLMNISATAEFSSPMLRLVAIFGLQPNGTEGQYSMTASLPMRYVAPFQIGAVPCPALNQVQGTCS